MENQHSRLVICFIDICGSTKLYERYGDAEALKAVTTWMTLISETIQDYSGTVLRTIGDEVFCTFPTPKDAIEATAFMQRSVPGHNSLKNFKIEMRIGLHFGDVLKEKGEIYGDAVNLAARLTSVAKANQIITSSDTVQAFPEVLLTKSRKLGRVSVKGKIEEVVVYELLWQEDEADLTTVQESSADTATRTSSALTLRYGDTEVRLNDQKTSVTLGRGDKNAFVINEKMASRNHATVEYKQGTYILTDFSTNGTHVKMYDGQKFFVHRQEFQLYKKGIISLGREISGDTSNCIFFTQIVGFSRPDQ